jgi:hypothetical protein
LPDVICSTWFFLHFFLKTMNQGWNIRYLQYDIIFRETLIFKVTELIVQPRMFWVKDFCTQRQSSCASRLFWFEVFKNFFNPYHVKCKVTLQFLSSTTIFIWCFTCPTVTTQNAYQTVTTLARLIHLQMHIPTL